MWLKIKGDGGCTEREHFVCFPFLCLHHLLFFLCFSWKVQLTIAGFRMCIANVHACKGTSKTRARLEALLPGGLSELKAASKPATEPEFDKV